MIKTNITKYCIYIQVFKKLEVKYIYIYGVCLVNVFNRRSLWKSRYYM